jgi:hypothetical protein
MTGMRFFRYQLPETFNSSNQLPKKTLYPDGTFFFNHLFLKGFLKDLASGTFSAFAQIVQSGPNRIPVDRRAPKRKEKTRKATR